MNPLGSPLCSSTTSDFSELTERVNNLCLIDPILGFQINDTTLRFNLKVPQEINMTVVSSGRVQEIAESLHRIIDAKKITHVQFNESKPVELSKLRDPIYTSTLWHVMAAAVEQGEIAILEILSPGYRKIGASLQSGYRGERAGTYLTEIAVREKQLPTLQYLLTQGVDTKACQAALTVVLETGYVEGLCCLLEWDPQLAHTQILNKMILPLVEAALQKNIVMIDLLLANDASISRALGDNCLSGSKEVTHLLLDRAIGRDLENLEFLDDLKDISLLNFVGLSLQGKPITHEMLSKFKGFKEALVVPGDYEKLEEPRRRELQERLKAVAGKFGETILADKVISLIPISVAAENGDTETVSRRLQAGCNPNTRDNRLKFSTYKLISPLGHAIWGGHREILSLLLSYRAKLDGVHGSVSNFSLSARDLAYHSGHLDLLPIFEAPESKIAPLSDGTMPLSHAARLGNLEHLYMLISAGADVNDRGRGNKAPLQEAMESNHRVVAFQLLNAGADPSKYITPEAPFATAARNGDVDMMEKMMNHPNCYKAYAKALYWAVVNLHCEAVLKIPQFDLAVLAQNKDVFSDLFRHEINLSSRSSMDNFCEIIKNLISRGFDINNQNRDQCTLLYFAVGGCKSNDKVEALTEYSEYCLFQCDENGFLQAIQILCSLGADVNIPAAGGETPIFKSIKNKHTLLTWLLLRNGANPNAVDIYGDTPLHKAAEISHNKLVNLLIGFGADINSRNSRGKTPYDLISENTPHNDPIYNTLKPTDVPLP